MNTNKSFSKETSDRYANALFELASESAKLDEIQKNAKELIEIYDKESYFQSFVKNPTETNSNHLKVIKEISVRSAFSKIFENFLSLLVVKRRFFFLRFILSSFIQMTKKRKGIRNAKLISSKDLSESELKNVSLELSKTIGSNINFDYSVDKDLIGGFKLQIDSLMIDTSVKNRIKKYEKIMVEN